MPTPNKLDPAEVARAMRLPTTAVDAGIAPRGYRMLAKIPRGRLVLVEEIANTIAFMVSEECSFTTGFTFDISGGRATY